MRRGIGTKFIQLDGKTIGINLGRDCVSEHEWGIGKLRRALRMDDGKIGAEYFQACPPFPDLKVLEKDDEQIVLCDPYALRIRFHKEPSFEEIKTQNELHTWGQDDLSAAWDDESFGIFVKGAVNKQLLKDAVLDPYRDGDLMVFVSSFLSDQAGLTILRASAFPDSERAALKAKHEDRIALLDAAEKTGIRETLLQAGKEFLALSPRWTKEFKGKQTAFPVVFWLNPMRQQQDHYGWFTVEELMLWIKNEGPIPMSPESA